MKKLTLLVTALMLTGITFAGDHKGCCKKSKGCCDKHSSASCKDKAGHAGAAAAQTNTSGTAKSDSKKS